MAKKVSCVVLLCLIALTMLASPALARGRGGPGAQGSLHPSQCGSQCNRRCGNTQYHNACILFCNKCCLKCLCVPPGYYGNKQVCPCYNNWKTKEGGPKCP